MIICSLSELLQAIYYATFIFILFLSICLYDPSFFGLF